MKAGRRWIAIDSLSESTAAAVIFEIGLVELTPGDIGFLALSVNETIKAWGDPEGELDQLRRKLRGEDER